MKKSSKEGGEQVSNNEPATRVNRYMFDANRTRGRRKVRYVETSDMKHGCTVCHLTK